MTRIKKLLLLILSISFLTSNNSNGQLKKIDQVELVQNFQLGTKYQYEVQRGKIDSRQPGSENIKSATEIEFNILTENNDIKECSWKYGLTKAIGVNPNQIDEQSKKLMNIYQGFEVKFTIDNRGIIQEITNFEECKIYIKNTFKLIYENDSNKMTQEQYNNMMETLKASYESPEILVSTYCPELTIFFAMFGEAIKSDSAKVSKSDLPNPFGGRNFPTNVSTKIQSIKDSIALIAVNQTILSNDFNSIMKETFIELSKLSEKPFNENEIPKMNMSTNTTYNYNFQIKSLNEVYTEKLIEVDDVKQIQTLKVIFKN